MAKAVCDAGPLIHLSEIQQVSLLSQFEPLIVPESVIAEARTFSCPPALSIKVSRPSQSSLELLEILLSTRLDRGETDCLALCNEDRDAIFLTDDLRARKAAEGLKIPVPGSVGVIVRAFRLGMISQEAAERTLFDLGDAKTLFISRAIIVSAVSELRRPRGE